jgi:DNA-binding PucR family transcriptional regulator
VSYRLQRIEKIGGFDLADSDARLSAQIALKILDAVTPRH